MRGNPAWNEGRNIRRVSEMLGTKNGNGNCKKESAKRHDLVDAMFLRQFPENFDEADDEKQRRTNINPECYRRHAKRRGSQSRYDDNNLLETAHDDLQRWMLSSVNSSGDILKSPTKGDNHTVIGAQDSRTMLTTDINPGGGYCQVMSVVCDQADKGSSRNAATEISCTSCHLLGRSGVRNVIMRNLATII